MKSLSYIIKKMRPRVEWKNKGQSHKVIDLDILVYKKGIISWEEFVYQ